MNNPKNIIITPPKKFSVVVQSPTLPVVNVTKKIVKTVTIGLVGLQGASGANAPLDVEPVAVYLNARGVNPNGNNS